MQKNIRNLILLILGILVIVGVVFFLISKSAPVADSHRVQGDLTLQQLADKTACVLPKTGDSLDDFAKCIKDSGATFYGAFWCPHCKDQKDLFGNSAQYLPYVECSTPDGNGQLPLCMNQGIQVYPTWQFK